MATRRSEMEGMMIADHPSSEWGAVVAGGADDHDRRSGAIAAVGAWIMVISFDHKNRVIVMVLSGLEMAREATSPVTKAMESSLLAAAGDDVLRPHRIWDQLVVVDVMGGLDYPMECPPLIGLPEMRTTTTVTTGVVKTSPMLAGGSRRWKGWWLPLI
ncbi:hypothetical protein ACLOJK_040750 [Asimina triloba]